VGDSSSSVGGEQASVDLVFMGVRLWALAVSSTPQRDGGASFTPLLIRSMGTGEGSRFTGEAANLRRKLAATTAAEGLRAMWASLEAMARVGPALSQEDDLGSMLSPSNRECRAGAILGGMGSIITRPARA